MLVGDGGIASRPRHPECVRRRGRTTRTFDGNEPVNDTIRSSEVRFRSVGVARVEQLPPEATHCADRDQAVRTREKYEVCTTEFCAIVVWMPPGAILAKS